MYDQNLRRQGLCPLTVLEEGLTAAAERCEKWRWETRMWGREGELEAHVAFCIALFPVAVPKLACGEIPVEYSREWWSPIPVLTVFDVEQPGRCQ